jgi:hypothetical protein
VASFSSLDFGPFETEYGPDEVRVPITVRETVGLAQSIGRPGSRPLRDCRSRQSVNSRPDGIHKRRAKREDREERDAGRPWELRDPSAGTEAGRYGTAARGSP